MATMIRVVGKDLQGIPRVWGDGNTVEEAFEQAERAAFEYCKRRPDCWPMQLVQETTQ